MTKKCFGELRSNRIRFNTPTTSVPFRALPTSIAKLSLVNTSTMVSARNRRPSVSWSATKSKLGSLRSPKSALAGIPQAAVRCPDLCGHDSDTFQPRYPASSPLADPIAYAQYSTTGRYQQGFRNVFSQHILQHGLVQRQIGHNPFRSGVLLCHLLQLSDLIDLQSGVLLLPPVTNVCSETPA
jgi:hypothetical protein